MAIMIPSGGSGKEKPWWDGTIHNSNIIAYTNKYDISDIYEETSKCKSRYITWDGSANISYLDVDNYEFGNITYNGATTLGGSSAYASYPYSYIISHDFRDVYVEYAHMKFVGAYLLLIPDQAENAPAILIMYLDFENGTISHKMIDTILNDHYRSPYYNRDTKTDPTKGQITINAGTKSGIGLGSYITPFVMMQYGANNEINGCSGIIPVAVTDSTFMVVGSTAGTYVRNPTQRLMTNARWLRLKIDMSSSTFAYDVALKTLHHPKSAQLSNADGGFRFYSSVSLVQNVRHDIYSGILRGNGYDRMDSRTKLVAMGNIAGTNAYNPDNINVRCIYRLSISDNGNDVIDNDIINKDPDSVPSGWSAWYGYLPLAQFLMSTGGITMSFNNKIYAYYYNRVSPTQASPFYGTTLNPATVSQDLLTVTLDRNDIIVKPSANNVNPGFYSSYSSYMSYLFESHVYTKKWVFATASNQSIHDIFNVGENVGKYKFDIDGYGNM